MSIPFESLPPEIQEALKAEMQEHAVQHDLFNMRAEANRHRVRDLFESLDEEGLQALRALIHSIGSVGNGENRVAAFYMGLTAGVLSARFGYCLVCQEKHEDPAEHLAKLVEEPELFSQEQANNMKTYDLEPDETGAGFRCKNCKMFYISIEDRMKRPPGVAGCGGCKQKAAWG